MAAGVVPMDLLADRPRLLQEHQDAQLLAVSLAPVVASRPAGEPPHGPPPRHVLPFMNVL